jgi:thiamine-monophosphate kinase
MTSRGEFAWIERLLEILGPAARVGGRPGGRVAAGDDVATIDGPGGETWAWTADTLVEGVHFRFDWLDPEAVGHRALAASLSDLAAAVAAPIGALVTVAGSPAGIESVMEGIYGGIRDLAIASGCPILGGDLSRADGPLHLTVSALGRCPRGAPPGRAGARPGDRVWVTGALGAPAAAIELLSRAGDTPARLAEARAHPAVRRLARPEPRIEEIEWLAGRAPLHASIDVSDGLSGDLAHLARRSGVRIAIETARLPVHADALDAAERIGGDARSWALHGGEEFEVVVCAPPGSIEPHVEEFASRFGIPLTPIGTVEEGRGVVGRDDGGDAPVEAGGWDHFRSSAVAPSGDRR